MTTEIDTRTPEEHIAQSIIPYQRDDPRARYLGLRASGFTIREALRLVGKAHSTLSFWRQNDDFVDLEQRLPEFKKELALEYANLEFLRNYRLVLEKDYRILKSSLNPDKDTEGKPIPMPTQDQAYLLKMRTHYTPQQLQIIETLIRAETAGTGFDFTQFILTASKIEQRVSLEVKRGNLNEELSTLPEPHEED